MADERPAVSAARTALTPAATRRPLQSWRQTAPPPITARRCQGAGHSPRLSPPTPLAPANRSGASPRSPRPRLLLAAAAALSGRQPMGWRRADWGLDFPARNAVCPALPAGKCSSRCAPVCRYRRRGPRGNRLTGNGEGKRAMGSARNCASVRLATPPGHSVLK